MEAKICFKINFLKSKQHFDTIAENKQNQGFHAEDLYFHLGAYVNVHIPHVYIICHVYMVAHTVCHFDLKLLVPWGFVRTTRLLVTA